MAPKEREKEGKGAFPNLQSDVKKIKRDGGKSARRLQKRTETKNDGTFRGPFG